MSKQDSLKWNGSNEAARQHAEALEQLRRKTQQPAKPKRSRQKFVRPNYHEYIRSGKWNRKRRKAIKAAGGRCSICGCADRLEVHHKHYRTLGRESLVDLLVVCQECHRNEHEADGKAMDRFTREFIEITKDS